MLYNKNLILGNILGELSYTHSKYSYLKKIYDKLVESTRGLSNKSKKSLKKEKTSLIKKGLNPESLYKKLKDKSFKISQLRNVLVDKKKDLDTKIENLQKLSLGELFKQYEEIRSMKYYGQMRRPPYVMYNPLFQLNKRYYSTSISRIKNNSFITKFNINNSNSFLNFTTTKQINFN